MAARKKSKSASGRGRTVRLATESSRTNSEQNHLGTNRDHAASDLTSALAIAEQKHSQADYAGILIQLLPFESRYPFDDLLQRGQFNRLLGFAYAHTGQFAQAEQIARRALTEFPEGMDFYYVLCYARLALREYDDAIVAGRAFLTLYQQQPDTSAKGGSFQSSRERVAYVHNLVGSAHMEKGESDQAVARFKQAVAADPRYHLPYLNLARQYSLSGRQDQSLETLVAGLSACSQKDELKMLMQSYASRPTISACMIVKNEEQLLPGCLDSVRDWVDEIIVVDTGSTDRTVAIAESHGARVYHHAWDGDFSKARNFSLDYATKEWIFIIDADERVPQEDVPLIRETLATTALPIVSVNVFNRYEYNKNITVFLPSIRFFKRDLKLRYRGIVHNQLDLAPGTRVHRVGVHIEHLGYGLSPEKMAQKHARTKALLEKQLAENPNDPFALFNYAQLLRSDSEGFSVANAPSVIASATRAVQMTSPDDPATRYIHLMCLDQLGWAYFLSKQYETAMSYCRQALAAKPDYLDPLLLLGHIHMQMADYPAAIASYQRYLAVQAVYDPAAEADSVILLHLDSRTIAYFSLALIAELIRDAAAAREYYSKTLELDPQYLTANENLGRLLLGEGDYAEAEKHFLKQLEIDARSRDSILGLAEVYEQRGQYREAKAQLQQLAEDCSEDVELLVRLGRLSLRVRDEAEAERYFLRAANSPTLKQEALRSTAEAYQCVGRNTKAAETYEQLLSRFPATAETLNDLGNCHFRMGDYATALNHYRKALELEPTFAPTWRNLGLTLARMNQPVEAAELLEKYVRACPFEADLIGIAADLHMLSGQPRRALPLYERYASARPHDHSGLYRLAECYLALGQKDAAILGYQHLVRTDPGYRPAIERLAELGELVTSSSR